MHYIVHEITKTRDHIDLQAILDDRGVRLRVHMRRDSYDVQSYGRVEVWTDAGWTHVYTRPGPKLQSQQVNRYHEEDLQDALYADRDALFEIAWHILKGFYEPDALMRIVAHEELDEHVLLVHAHVDRGSVAPDFPSTRERYEVRREV